MAESQHARGTYANHRSLSPHLHFNDEERQALLDQARAGSVDAHGELLDSYWPLMRGYFRHRLSRNMAQKADADDLAQDACLRAHRAFAGFIGCQLGQYRAWLMTICQNLVAEVLRRFSGAEHNLALEEPLGNQSLEAAGQRGWARQQSPEEIVAALERHDQLEAALNQLPADERQIVVWRQFQELTFIEIAGRLRRTRRVVERAFYRAFGRLRGALSPVASRQVICSRLDRRRLVRCG
jgi:RNA polymerase sigma-70 factor (ECF subfamily)